jgi:hypothetical protein
MSSYDPRHDSDSSDNIPWVPNPDDIASYREGLPSRPSWENDRNSDLVDSRSITSSELPGEFSGPFDHGGSRSVDDDDDFIANPDVYDEEVALAGVVARNGAGRGSEMRTKTSRSLSVESFDSVMSYTGRIGFITTPEVIEFEDLPGEERGDPHQQRQVRKGRRPDDAQREAALAKRELRRSARANRPDPCVYYTLCIIMVGVPAVVLVVMFVFVLDVRGGDDEG